MFHCLWLFQFFFLVVKATVPKAVWNWIMGLRVQKLYTFKSGFSSLLSHSKFFNVSWTKVLMWHYCGRRHRVRELLVWKPCYHLDVRNVQRCLAWAGLMHMYKQSLKHWEEFTMKTCTLLALWAGISAVIVFHLEI